MEFGVALVVLYLAPSFSRHPVFTKAAEKRMQLPILSSLQHLPWGILLSPRHLNEGRGGQVSRTFVVAKCHLPAKVAFMPWMTALRAIREQPKQPEDLTAAASHQMLLNGAG